MKCHFCGYQFDDACGFYGCPNCLGEGLDDRAALDRILDGREKVNELTENQKAIYIRAYKGMPEGVALRAWERFRELSIKYGKPFAGATPVKGGDLRSAYGLVDRKMGRIVSDPILGCSWFILETP